MRGDDFFGCGANHVANPKLMPNGAEFAVYVNMANEFNALDAGALTDEAIS